MNWSMLAAHEVSEDCASWMFNVRFLELEKIVDLELFALFLDLFLGSLNYALADQKRFAC